MNQVEFKKQFSVFCGAYGRHAPQEEFMARAHWLKFQHINVKDYLDIVCRAIDTYPDFLPSVGKLMEIYDYRKSLEPEKKDDHPINHNKAHMQKCVADMKIALIKGREKCLQREKQIKPKSKKGVENG